MRIVDLSAPIAASPPDTVDLLRTEIEFVDHAGGAAQIQEMFGVGRELLRREEGSALENFLRLGTHSSTHVDAPCHYNSIIQGKPAQTIDQLPLDWFFRPGVVLDFHQRQDGETIEIDDLQQALTNAGHELAPFDIVLVRTGRDAFYESPDYP